MGGFKNSIKWIWIFMIFMWALIVIGYCQINNFSEKFNIFEIKYKTLLGKPSVIDKKINELDSRFTYFEKSLIYNYNCKEE